MHDLGMIGSLDPVSEFMLAERGVEMKGVTIEDHTSHEMKGNL